MKIKNFTINFTIQNQTLVKVQNWFEEHALSLVVFVLTVISGLVFIYYYLNGLGLAYNDARSHLDIGRRVVEGLKPGLAQIGSVWLPLPHLLMIPTVWNDFMWHSGFFGALISMISFFFSVVFVFLFFYIFWVGC